MNSPDRRGTPSQEKRIRGSHTQASFEVHGREHKARPTRLQLEPQRCRAELRGTLSCRRQTCSMSVRHRDTGPPRGTQQEQHRSPAGPAERTAGRWTRPSKGQPYLQAAAVTRSTARSARPPDTGTRRCSSSSYFPHEVTAAGCHRERPSPPAPGKRPNRSRRSAGTTAASSPPRTHRTHGDGSKARRRGVRRSPARHSQAEHALHLLDLPAAELLELGVGVEDGGPAGLRRALVDVVPPGQLSAQLRARAGRQAAPLLLARLGRGWDLRVPLIALRRRPALLQQQPPLQFLSQLLRGHRPAPPPSAGRDRAVRRTACPGPELYSLTRRRRAERSGAGRGGAGGGGAVPEGRGRFPRVTPEPRPPGVRGTIACLVPRGRKPWRVPPSQLKWTRTKLGPARPRAPPPPRSVRKAGGPPRPAGCPPRCAGPVRPSRSLQGTRHSPRNGISVG